MQRFTGMIALVALSCAPMAGIAATGQDKVKKGFGPAVPGFRHVPFNDLEAVRAALTSATAAVLPGAHADDNEAIESGKIIETTPGDGAAGGDGIELECATES